MFGFRRIYGILEKMMTFFLVFMVCAFLVNLIWAIAMKPNPGGVLGQAAAGACNFRLPEGVDWVLISVRSAGKAWKAWMWCAAPCSRTATRR